MKSLKDYFFEDEDKFVSIEYNTTTSDDVTLAGAINDPENSDAQGPVDPEDVLPGGANLSLVGELRLYSETSEIFKERKRKIASVFKSKLKDEEVTVNRVKFTNDWNEVEKELLSYTEYKVLILSSVIHEVYSYGTEESVRVFWDRVIHSGFHYICVRDMMYSEDMDRQTNPLTSHRYGLEKLTKAPLNTCLKEFEEKWGSINNNKNLIHFLLKYRWQINWERELNENYFPIEFHLFLSKFESMYNQTYLERFRVPFLEDCWKKDFDITVNDYTHIKAIFERKK